MDNDSPVSGVERTFWTVWYYITGAVSRFLSPDPTNTVRNEPDSFQDSAADSEPANCGHAEGNAGEMEVVGELPLATVSVLSSSQPLVAWELPTTDIDLGPDEERVQFKTQLSRGSEGKASDEAEDMTEEQFALTGNDGAGLLIPEDAKENKEENGVRILSPHGLDEMQENDKYEEHMSTRSSGLTGDGVSEDVEERGRQAVAEEEMTPDDRQKKDENLTKIETEEEDKILHEDEQDLKAEDVEVKLCTVTALSLEEGRVHIEERRVQRDMADTAVKHEGVEDTDGALLLASENENKSDERTRQAENQLIVCEDLADYDRDIQEDQSFTSLHAELQMDKSPCESTLDEREQGVVIEEKKGSGAANQTTDEMPAQEVNITSVTEGQEEDISTRHVTVGEEFMQNARTEHVEFTVGEQEGVAKDTDVQTKARETDDVKTESYGEVIEGNVYMSTGNISVGEKFIDKDQVEAERLLSERDGKESYMEVACTAKSVTVKPEGETGQEISGEFKNTPPGICEGQFVVSQELNSPAYEETQEGVPEYNNEPGPDENTTQRFLEEGDCKEIQNTQLPEEVESKELESFQNNDCGSGADFLLVREHIEEEQERTEDIKNSFELVVEQDTGILHLTDAGLSEEGETPLAEPVIQGSGLLFEEEKGRLLVDSMKTVIEHSEKESEMHMGLTDETDETTKLLRDETEEFVVEKDEVLCDIKEADGAGDHHEMTGAIAAEEVVGLVDGTSKFPKAEVQKITETHFFREREDIINSEQNSCRTSGLVEDITESGFLKQLVESEPKLPEDIAVEMQDASIDMKKTHHRVEEEAAEYEVQNKNEIEILNLQLAEMAAGPITERNEKENTLTAESESPGTQNQLSAESLEINNKETEASGQSVTSDSKPKDLTAISEEEISKPVTESEGSYAEGSVSHVSGYQDVIDEEILDLWIQTALSEDTDGTKQEGPEPGQQMDREIEPSKEEQNETSSVQTEKDKEQLVESNSGESELVSDPEMSSSTGECGFLDKSLWEWGAQNNETQLLTSSSTGSIQGVCDMLSNMSESTDISELSTQQSNSESQEILMEEATETVQSYLKEEESVPETGSHHHHNSGVTSSEASHLVQDLDTLPEDTEEETGSKKETNAEVTDLAMKTSWKDTEEAGAKSLTEMSTLLKAEEIEVEDEPLDMTVSDSPEGTEHTDSGCSRSGSEASLKGILSTDSGSQDGSCTESETELLKLPTLEKPQTEQSEDDIDLLAGLNRAEVTEELTTEAEDQMEVDASVLDFTAQRSRIAVKNPRVRPPKDPRTLLHKPSVDPTPSSRLPVKIPAGVPLGGLGIGIKLPGLGAGIPVLKKTQRVMKDENSQEVLSQKPETNPEEKRNTPKPDEAQHKPKWMPPRQPGFGNPLMSELKTKLKKTPKSD